MHIKDQFPSTTGQFIAFQQKAIPNMGLTNYYTAYSCWWNEIPPLSLFSYDEIKVAPLLLG